MRARLALPSALLRTLLGWGLLGIVIGFVTGARMPGANPSVRSEDALIIAWNLGAICALGAALFGLVVAALTRLIARTDAGVADAPFRRALIAGSGACAVGIGGLALVNSPGGTLFVGAVVAAVAIGLNAWARRRAALGAWLLAGVVVVWLGAGYTMVAASSSSREYVPFQAEWSAPDAPAVLIGIDGADWGLLTGLVADGRLPNIQELIRKGTTASLSRRLARESWTARKVLYT